MFEDLWRRQLAFTSLALQTLDPKKPLDQLTEEDRRMLTHRYIEALHSELVEALNCIPWKSHRYNQPAGTERLLEELIDVQKFLWGLMQVWGFSPGDVQRAFNTKSDIVERRFYQDHLLPSQLMNRNVAVVDIDGVVADWNNGFVNWVQENEPKLEPRAYDKHVDPGLRQALKEKLYASGGMRGLPLMPGAIRAISKLQDAGYTIVWLTARPVSRHPRLEADTVAWLREHNLPTDYIYWSDMNKHLFIIEKLPMAAVLFDDEPEIVAHAMEFGVRAYLVNNNFEAKVREFLKENK